MAECIYWQGVEPTWCLQFERDAHDWEIDLFIVFFERLYACIIDREVGISWFANRKKNKVFTVKATYDVLMKTSNYFLSSRVWLRSVPTKVSFLTC